MAVVQAVRDNYSRYGTVKNAYWYERMGDSCEKAVVVFEVSLGLITFRSDQLTLGAAPRCSAAMSQRPRLKTVLSVIVSYSTSQHDRCETLSSARRVDDPNNLHPSHRSTLRCAFCGIRDRCRDGHSAGQACDSRCSLSASFEWSRFSYSQDTSTWHGDPAAGRSPWNPAPQNQSHR